MRRFRGVVSSILVLGAVSAALADSAPADYAKLDAARHGALLERGASGEEVTALQHALAAASAPVPVTGTFDAKTVAAVESFQSSHGCATDGIVGPETMHALDVALGVVEEAPRLVRLEDSEVTPAITEAAKKILHDHGADPIGTEVPFTADGKKYVGRIELHYHTPGGPMKPWGYHHGVSVFRVVDDSPPAEGSTVGPSLAPTGFPPRAKTALTGSAWIEETKHLTRSARETAIFDQLSSGNLPSFLRSYVDVTVSGHGHTLVFHVLPDYLAIGSDDDFVRIPMAAPTAQKVCDLAHASLPTRKMVDLIWKAAPIEVAPIPMTPGPEMMSNAYFLTHQEKVEAELAKKPRGELAAGMKKDLVITNLLARHPGKVAIYGWHRLDGKPIQPLSTVHEASYADYSHGVRLVDLDVILDGKKANLDDVLKDEALSVLLSDEGPIASPRIP